MNWFQRYGIPGAHFYFVLLAGLYAIYPCKVANLDMRALATFAVSFLPVGYLISVLGQWLYISSKKYGLHTQAARICRIQLAENMTEADLEALSCFGVAKDLPRLKAHLFIQDWLRKRMDVVAINYYIQIATGLGVVMAILLGYGIWGSAWQPKCFLIVSLLIIYVLIFCVTYLCNSIVEKQIVKVISDAWTTFQFNGTDFLAPPPPLQPPREGM
ncbi:MAG: hypothetical protein ABR913_00375 [Sedimentisphaerales bacterium]|jgi:hypothetical protein